jgi:ankyrin repeat protein
MSAYVPRSTSPGWLVEAEAPIEAGADVDAAAVDGATPLLIASEFTESPEVIALLLKAGAKVKAEDSDGKTAIYYASQNAALRGTEALKELSDSTMR